jgi:WD40 repeat protein
MKKPCFFFICVIFATALNSFAVSLMDIPATWTLQSLATNGKDYAFSFVDRTKAADGVYLQVNQKRLGPFARVTRLGWSPDGSALGFCAGEGKAISVYVDLKKRGSFDEIWQYIWAPKGSDLAVVGVNGTKTSIQLNAGSAVLYDKAVEGGLEPGMGFRDPHWSPDGKRFVFFFSHFGQSVLWDGLKPVEKHEGIFDLSLSPDGKSLAFGAFDKKMWYLHRGDQTIGPEAVGFYGVAWAPDSRRLAYSRSSYNTPCEIWVDNQMLTQVSSKSGVYPRWSPDGQQIAFEYTEPIGDRFFYYNGEILGPFMDDYYLFTYRWSADSKHFAVPVQKKDGSKNWTVLVDGEEVGPFPERPLLPDAPWSPDGSKFAFITYTWSPTAHYTLFVDGVSQAQGFSLDEAVWAADSHHLAFQREEDNVTYSKVLFEGEEYPGTVFAGKVLMVENGKLLFK